MSRNSNKPRHLSRLGPSKPDDIALASAVEERFILLCKFYRQQKGMDLIPPAGLDRDMMFWRTMRVRHKKGDFRHTEGEMKALRHVAEWTLRVNAKLRNQPTPRVDWGD